MKEQTFTVGHEGSYKEVTLQMDDHSPEIWGAERNYSIVGKQKIQRVDAIDKITGRAKFTYDIKRPNMVYAVLVTCPHASATIQNVDISEAETMPGVVTIEVISSARRASYAGTAIAVVVAETIQQAQDAARKVQVEYELSSFQVIPEQSVASNITPRFVNEVLEDDVEGNLAASLFTFGDIDIGFRQAETTVENVYTTPMTPHFCLETHGSVSEWNDGELTVWTSTQALWRCQTDAASAGRISSNKTRLICQHMGGGFGSKFGLEPFDKIGIQISQKTGRSVKIMADRWYDATACGYKPGAFIDMKIGAKQDGELTSIAMNVRADSSQFDNFAEPIRTGYECPNINTSIKGLSLNIAPPRAFRGPGRSHTIFALELALEELAVKLDMNPLDLRMRNVSSHETDARKYILETGAEHFGWAEKFQKHGSSTGSVKKGVGLAMCSWAYGSSPNTCTAHCTIYHDGSVEVATGTQDLGTGNRTAMAIVAAESLGIGTDGIKVTIGDTEIGLKAPVSWGSVSTGAIAPAIRTAAYEVQQKLFTPIAEAWNNAVDDIQCEQSIIFSKSNPEKQLTWEQATRQYVKGPISSMSSNSHLSVRGIKTGSMVRGAHFVEVEVDTNTGKVKCTKYTAVHECGKTIARAQAESQICGGVIMGLGYALSEEWLFDPIKGRPLNSNLENYKVIGLLETPEIEPVLVDVYDPINNACAKGLGEPPHIPVAAAIACAVYNALGIPIRDLPITPSKVLQALQRKAG